MLWCVCNLPGTTPSVNPDIVDSVTTGGGIQPDTEQVIDSFGNLSDTFSDILSGFPENIYG